MCILIQDGIAVVEGIAPGKRVVVEGAQNLRPGSVVVEADRTSTGKAGKTSVQPDSTGKQ